MNIDSPDSYYAKRTAHERARQQSQVRVASVLGAHGALYTSIRSGFLQMNDRLDEMSLAPMFSVSRNSLRGALKLLADEGVVTRAPRVGTTVVSQSVDVPLDTGHGWGAPPHPHHQSIVTDNRLVASTPFTRRYLETTNDNVHVLELVAVHGGIPTLLCTKYSLADGAERPLVASPADGDFRAVFEATYGSALGRVECWFEAKGADERSASRLHTSVGTPLLVRSRVLRSADGRARELSITHYVGAHVNMCGPTDTQGAGCIARQHPAEGSASTCVPLARQAADPGVRRRSSSDLHTELRAAIRDGLYQEGDRLSEDQLADAYGASRNTVRLVLATLTEDGILQRSRRDGTVVISRVADFTLNDGMPYRSTDRLLHSSEQLTSVRIPTPPFIAGLLRTDSEFVSREEYLGRRDGQTITCYIRYTVPATPVPRPLTTGGDASFASLFAATYGTPLGRIENTLHTIRAEDQVARRLGVSPGSILMLVERTVFDADDTPREFSHSYYRATHVTLASHHTISAVHQAA